MKRWKSETQKGTKIVKIIEWKMKFPVDFRSIKISFNFLRHSRISLSKMHLIFSHGKFILLRKKKHLFCIVLSGVRVSVSSIANFTIIPKLDECQKPMNARFNCETSNVTFGNEMSYEITQLFFTCKRCPCQNLLMLEKKNTDVDIIDRWTASNRVYKMSIMFNKDRFFSSSFCFCLHLILRSITSFAWHSTRFHLFSLFQLVFIFSVRWQIAATFLRFVFSFSISSVDAFPVSASIVTDVVTFSPCSSLASFSQLIRTISSNNVRFIPHVYSLRTKMNVLSLCSEEIRENVNLYKFCMQAQKRLFTIKVFSSFHNVRANDKFPNDDKEIVLDEIVLAFSLNDNRDVDVLTLYEIIYTTHNDDDTTMISTRRKQMNFMHLSVSFDASQPNASSFVHRMHCQCPSSQQTRILAY